MRILIATDGSAHAAIAGELGRNLAAHDPAELRFVAVLPPVTDLLDGSWPGAIGLDPEPVQRPVEDELEAWLRSEVDRTAAWLPDELDQTPAILRPSCVLLRGAPAQSIVTEADDWGADLIIVGSRGRRAAAATLLGSVSEEVIDRARMPVLVARRPEARRLLVAVDPSPGSTAAVDFLAECQAFRGLEACVLAVSPTDYPWWVGLADGDSVAMDSIANAQETGRLDERQASARSAARLVRAGFRVIARQPSGDVAREITGMATALEIDTIVVGTHGRTGLSRLLQGSVSRNVLHHTGCSLLVVHPRSVAAPIATGNEESPAEEPAGARSIP